MSDTTTIAEDLGSDAVLVRQAGQDDLEAVAGLFDGYRVFYKKDTDLEGARQFVADRLENQDSVIFLAEDDGGIPLGFTQLYPLFSSVRMQPSWLLNDLYVAPGMRKRGVGHALMRRAQEFAAKTGAAGLELATAVDNESAKSLYHDLGWELDTEFHHYSYTVR